MKRSFVCCSSILALVWALAGCKTATPQVAERTATSATTAAASAPAKAAPAIEILEADGPRTTVAGNTFLAPAGWSVWVSGASTVLQAPEGDSRIALIDVRAASAEDAVALAWKAYKPDASWPLKVVNQYPDRDGWSDRAAYSYQTSPNEKRDVAVSTRRAGEVWTVVIYDMAQAVAEKRLAQVALIFDRLLPRGYTRESFAGKPVQPLDAAHVQALSAFVTTAMQGLGVPGVAMGLVQGGKVVFEGGFGVRQLGDKRTIDAGTLFMIASNTKALTTLLLARLVDEKKLTWDTPVTRLLPSFKLGDDETTRQVLVKHLVCACTGLPRQDMEWLFEFAGATPGSALGTLATMQPTSAFGEMFQYSNPLAGAGGFVGGHVAFPSLELGAAYDEAMRTRVFSPLGMTSTTFDYKRALAGNHAMPHGQGVDGTTALASMALNYSIIPLRPAGAAWSNVRDLLRYVSMELAEGALPGGKRLVERDTLLARRAPQVSIGKDTIYGMGLEVDTTWEVPVVHHGGAMVGFYTDMLWLPEHGVGAVVLTNSDPGWLLLRPFMRKLLEVLFDGRDEADAMVAAQARAYQEQLAAERKLLVVPADPAAVNKLAARYQSATLGEIRVSQVKGSTVFDFGEWKSEVASRQNPDGTTSFITTAPGLFGFEFVVGGTGARALILRDAQHEYVFSEA